MMNVEEIDLLTVTYVKNKILSAAKIGMNSTKIAVPTKYANAVKNMLEKLGYGVSVSAGATNDTQTFLVAYTYPQLSSKECKTSGGIGVITAENAHDIATKNFKIGEMVNGIALKIIHQAKKGINDSENIVKEKFTDVYFVLDEAVLEYLKGYQIYAYLTEDGSEVIFKPSKDK